MGSSSNPFERTRADHRKETAEDYVELILKLAGEGARLDCEHAPHTTTTQIAKEFAVSQPTATKILNRLQGEGLVCIHPRSFVHLTQEGQDMAKASLLRHKVILDFLVTVGVSPAQAELDAEGIEHHLSDETLGVLKGFLERESR